MADRGPGVAAFLITGPERHVVLDGGYPTTARLIMASIAKLGFDIKDVKVLLHSEPHPDHAFRPTTVVAGRREPIVIGPPIG